MIEQPKDGFWLLLVYVLTAISGGLGGCASWAWAIRSFGRRKRYVFVTAYVIIGIVFGLAAAALSSVFFYDWVTDIHALVLFSLVAGSAGSVLVFAINWGAGLVLRWRGVELRLTFRDRKEERRGNDYD